jgi:hypothetical protein
MTFWSLHLLYEIARQDEEAWAVMCRAIPGLNRVYGRQAREGFTRVEEGVTVWGTKFTVWFLMFREEEHWHREGDQPAYIGADGAKVWYLNGKQHREGDQPARIEASGTQVWYLGGEQHREGDLPARIWADGTKEWWVNGMRHRDGGKPAYIWAHGDRQWWVNGVRVK